MIEVAQLKYKARDPFIPFHSRTQRWAVLVCHRRAGKTVAAINEIVIRALHTKKPRAIYAYVGPFKTQTKQIAWSYLKEAVKNIPGTKANENELWVQLPNEAKIFLGGADNPDSLRGLYFDGVVLDEFGDMKGRIWSEVIRPALMDRKGWATFIGTPRGKNKFYEMREKARKNPDRWFYLNLKASESGLLSEEELLEAREDMDEDEYQAEMECSFEAAIKGSYFAQKIGQLEAEGHITTVPPVDYIPVDTAWDLGFADATAVWFFQVVAGEIRIVDHYETSNMDIDTIIDEIVEKKYKLGRLYLPHDAKAKSLRTGKSLIEQLLAKDLDCEVMPRLEKKDSIAAARKTLPFCFFDHVKCYRGVELLKSYKRKWDAERKVYSNTPDHDEASHTSDAFQTLAIAVDADRLKRSKSKKAPPMTATQAKEKFEADRRINIVNQTPWTLDDLWSTAPKRTITRRI